jgi:2',3'-cyclic-nucleotide 2'-phosphodiesterase (5'-nucleotidase family)
MGRLTVAVALAAALVLAAAPASAPARQPKADFWLTVLHNNDGESRLINAGDGALADYGGIARFKTVVDRLKLEATEGAEAEARPGKDGVVMLSSGDNFLAGPQFQASLDKGPPFYDSIGLDLIGYDAFALGNHEFDFGPDVLADFIGGTTGTPGSPPTSASRSSRGSRRWSTSGGSPRRPSSRSAAS